MSVLIIKPEDHKRIKAAIEKARNNPVPLETVMAGAIHGKFEIALADRKPGIERRPSEHIVFEGGVRACISFEQQPSGLVRHLSVSVPTPGRLPNPVMVEFLCKQFGFRSAPPVAKFWLEEFDPGHNAVNVIELDQ
jgi:hypothetical protein